MALNLERIATEQAIQLPRLCLAPPNAVETKRTLGARSHGYWKKNEIKAVEEAIDREAAKRWGLSDQELAEITHSLREL